MKYLTSKIAFFKYFHLQDKEHLSPEVYKSLEKGQASDTSCKPDDRSHFSIRIKIIGVNSTL